MYDRILIPLDGSFTATTALVAGERLADRWDCEIKILTLLRTGDRAIDLDRTVAKQAERLRHDRTVDIRSLSYSVVEDIAAEFDEVERTLVVMSTWARGRSAGVIGNVAEDVMRHIRRPMLLLGPTDDLDDDWPAGPILACTDGSDFADSILPVAAEWSRGLDLPIEVISVIDPAMVPAGVSPALETAAASRAAHTLEHLLGHTVEHDTLHDSRPAPAIVDHAQASGASMIALATHGRSGTQRLRYGSVAMDVIRRATIPVLVNRPPISPHR